MFSRASRGALFAVRTRRGEMRREILRGDRDREKEEGKGVKRQPERNGGGEREGERDWGGERERERERGKHRALRHRSSRRGSAGGGAGTQVLLRVYGLSV